MSETTPLTSKRTSFRVESYDFRKNAEALQKENIVLQKEKIALQKELALQKENVPLQKKKMKKIFITDEYKEQINREICLIESLTISNDIIELINSFIENSFASQQYIAHIFAFTIIENSVRQIEDTIRYESRLVSIEKARDISRNQLCIDIENHHQCHRTVAGILIHLENMKPSPLHAIISRQRIIQRCKPSIHATTFWGQHFNHEADGFYYKIRIDWTQTKPMHTINDY